MQKSTRGTLQMTCYTVIVLLQAMLSLQAKILTRVNATEKNENRILLTFTVQSLVQS